MNQIEIFQKYRNTIESIPLEGRFMEYRWGKLPGQLNLAWMPYQLMFDDYSREIANLINMFTNYIHRLTAWGAVIEELEEQQKWEATYEFIEPVANVSLSLPYAIRSRFIFATAHLCHQANHAHDLPHQGDIDDDGGIYFDVCDKYGAGWKKYISLKLALEKIANKKHGIVTDDYRHKFNHRFPPRFVFGETQTVKRLPPEKPGETRLGIGGTPPLSLLAIVEALAPQRDLAYDAFAKFQSLIREHEQAIIDAETEHERQ